MRILLINHYAGSPALGMEYRPFHLAKEWVKAGHEVTIVAASHSHVRVIQPKTQGPVTEELVEGVRYLWLRTPGYSGNGPRRVANMLAFVARLRIHAGELGRKLSPQAVIASSTYPLDIVPARSIARRTGAKLIYEVHDLWPLSPMILGGMSPKHPFIIVMQWAENRAYRWSDKVVSLLPLAKEHMVSHGMSPGKFVHIPNGVVDEDWMNTDGAIPEEHEKKIAALKQDGKFLVCYAGAHGLANSLDAFVESAGKMKDERIHLVLLGDGPARKSLMEKAEGKGLGNISFLPSVPKTAIPAILAKMDVLFISLQKCELFRFGISPNKLLDYMMAGKPIINAVEAGNDPVRDAGCGLSIGAEDPEAIARAAETLAGLDEEERRTMGLKGNLYVREHHDYRKLAQSFLEVLKG